MRARFTQTPQNFARPRTVHAQVTGGDDAIGPPVRC